MLNMLRGCYSRGARIFALCILFSIQAVAGGIDAARVPLNVMEAFKSLYPNSTSKIDWTKKLNKYQADFVSENKSISLLFNRHGALVNSKIEIDSTEIPNAVLSEIRTKCVVENYKIVYIMKRWEKREDLLYETAIMKGRKIYILRYNSIGTLINEYILERIDLLNPYY